MTRTMVHPPEKYAFPAHLLRGTGAGLSVARLSALPNDSSKIAVSRNDEAPLAKAPSQTARDPDLLWVQDGSRIR